MSTKRTGRPPSVRNSALKALRSASGSHTKFAALRAAKPYLTSEEFGIELRKLAAIAKGRVLRLVFEEIAAYDAQADAEAKVAADAKRREEIDRILAKAAQELEARQETLNANPVQHAEPVVGPPTSSLPVPDYGPSSAPVATASELQELRAAALARGHELAESILAQLDRCYLVPFNREEAEKLDRLHAAFVAWERDARIRFPEIDTRTEFPDTRLRPPPSRITDERSYRIKRRTLSVDEQVAITMQLAKAQRTRTHEDSGFWGGIPKAC